MRMSTRFALPVLFSLALSFPNFSNAQTFYGGNGWALYQITVTGNSCNWTYIGNYEDTNGNQLGAAGGLTFCGGGLYMMTNNGDLYSVDPATAVCTLVLAAPSTPPLFLQGLTCAGNYFYAIEDNSGGGGEIFQYDVGAGTITSIGSIGTWGAYMIYLNGYLYVMTGTGNYVQVDPCNANNNTVLYNTNPIWSMTTIPGDPNNLLVGDFPASLSIMDIATGDQTFLCDAPNPPLTGIYNLASDMNNGGTPNCPPTLDLDANNSSGASGFNFNAPTFTCLSTGVPVADVDAVATSSSPIGQMTLTLTGILDAPFEALVLAGSFPDLVVGGSGTDELTLTNANGNATIADFLAALTAIVYQNNSPGPTAGVRLVSVSFDNTGGQTSNLAVAFIDVQASATIDAVVTHNTNCTAPNGGIDITVTPSGSYEYDWSNGATTQDIGSLSAGTYTVTVSSATGGCSTTASFEVLDQVASPVLSLVPTAANCGLSDGAVNLSVSGGTPPYTFAWSNSATTEDLANVPAGSYSVTVTGADGCTAGASATVTNNNIAIGITGNVLPNTSCTGTNGSVDITVSPANPPGGSYTFAWSNGATTQDLSNLAAGTYTVTVSYGSTCSASASFTVANEPALPNLSTAAIPATCGLSNGSVNLSVTGGASPYTFAWSNSATTEDLANLAAGSYTVTVTGANGCTASTSAVVASEDISIGITGSVLPNSSCTGANGSVGIVLSPPNPPSGSYTFAWSNGPTGQNISGLAAGTYTVTVSYGSTCSASASFTVANEPLLPNLSLAVSPSHCGLSDGTVNMDVTGGEAPFGHLWSNGANTEDLADLPAGGYSVTVTGANGCTSSTSATVPDNNITIGITGSVLPNTSCAVANGSVDVVADPPAPPGSSYAFAWSNGMSGQGISGLTSGTYIVTVSVGTCTANAGFGVVDGPAPPVLSTTASPSNCGLPDGAVDLGVTGGEAPFGYFWDNGANTEDLNSLAAGGYSVTVTGGNGCTASVPATVTDNNIAIGITGGTTPNTSCSASNGSVTTSVMPSVPPPTGGFYTYAWSNGANTQDIFGLSGGTYTVTATLGSTCTASASFDVGSGPQVPSPSFSTLPEDCNGPGSVNLTVTGGVPPYNYAWSNGATTEDLPAVPAGSYTVTVTGSDGCSATGTTVVGDNTAGADTTAVFGTSCDIGDIGISEVLLTNMSGCDSLVVTTVTLLASDTTAISGTSCDINDVGIFQQTLTNNNGCDSLIVTTISYAASDTTAIFGTSCDLSDVGIFEQLLTNSNGCDSLIVTTISYSAADTTAISGTSCDLNDVGIFEQLLTNMDGCDSLIVTTITYSAADTTSIFDTSCDINDVGIFEQTLVNSNGCDSLIITTITYSVADTTAIFDTSCDINDVGISEQTLTNGNGCDSLIVTTVTLLAADTTALSGTSCNPASVGVFVQNLTNQNGCDSTVVTTVVFSQSDTTLLSGTTCDVTEAGVFVQNLLTSEGCDSVVITTVALLPGSTTSLTSTTCDPAQAGVFTQNLTGQNGCDSTVTTTVTLLPGSETFLTATTCDANQTGTFVQNLTGQNGCDSTVTTTVALLPGSSTALTGTTCDPAMAGIFTQVLTNQNGCDSTVTAAVTLLPASTTSLTGTTCDPDEAGVFIQNLTGQNGCDSVVTTTITLLSSSTTSLTGTTCDPSATGVFVQNLVNQNGCDSVVTTTITLLSSSTTSLTGTTCDPDEAGVFIQNLTTWQGCDSTVTTTVALSQPMVALAVNGPGCFDEALGAVTASASGSLAPYLYSLDGGPWQASGLFGGLGAGVYEVAAQDANGCVATDLVAINSPVPLNVDLGDDVFLELGDGTVLSALVNVPYDSLAQILWSGIDNLECPGCPAQQVFPVVTTAYSVQVVDGNGCTASDGVTVFVDRRKGVYVPNAFSPNGDGINDLLLVFSKEGQVREVKSFLVFSRWGETVFQFFNFQPHGGGPHDPAIGWDGSHRGQLLDAGVFVWFAEVEFTDGETVLFEGDVVLVR